ncbi:hypothetical protein BK744_09530 [Bacillus thuringiensis serovar zhaodongensis]|uniref:hypothetical protein n=1 Tax=Bacillus cereus group TaxID=86661 RepID=UPI000A3D1D03|nr:MULTISPECIES: hypothetical protein [Bacillus cereus group]OUB76754.1 hypothetical protein BK744_09530 [Bacillus thuringiensis serovar zhaodongensis]GIX59446.1 hypothetical protein BPADB04_44760 [Bacillus paranthracis]
MTRRLLADKTEELLALWDEYGNYAQVAKHLQVTKQTVMNELKRLDEYTPNCKWEQVRSEFNQIKDTKEFYYVLGIIWGNGTLSQYEQKQMNSFIYKNKNKEVVNYIASIIPHTRVITLKINDEDVWLCSYTKSHPFYNYLLSLGWTGNRSEIRMFPLGEIDELEFTRGYVSVHHTLDARIQKNKRFPRLRIFGAEPILQRINQILHSRLNTSLKTVYTRENTNRGAILTYYSKYEIPLILNFLEREKLGN